MIKYLAYIYDKKNNEGVPCTSTTLQIHFKIRPNELAKSIAPAFKAKYLTCCGASFKLTKEGENYVESHRYGKANDRNDEEQLQG